MAPYSRRAGSSSAAMTCGPAGPCFGVTAVKAEGADLRFVLVRSCSQRWRLEGWAGALRRGGTGVGGRLHPDCFPPPWGLGQVWFHGPVFPGLLPATALFSGEQRQDEVLV